MKLKNVSEWELDEDEEGFVNLGDVLILFW